MRPKTKECPSCAMEVAMDNALCPICGYEFPRQKPIYQWIAILLVIIFLLAILL